MPTSHLLALAQAAGALWQSRLRRSARLFLALGEPGVKPLEIEARLRLVERQLVRHLLRAAPGQRPIAVSVAGARTIIEAAQAALLESETEIEQLLQELSAHQAINPTHGEVADERENLY
jgi:hypothetical protein